MSQHDDKRLMDLLTSLKNLPCWYVSCGGAAGPSFQLALGRKVSRSLPLKNAAHPEDYRLHEGEANLLVWCSWRLDSAEGPLVSSDCSSTAIMQHLQRLKGATLLGCAPISPAWDLKAIFDNDCCLYIFCDHVGDDASLDSNWELWCQGIAAIVGTGSRLTWETRKDEVVR